ncbi:MAG: hypothetical protein R2682_14055 [Pyrinomonadaceae bacterium]
MIRFLFKGVPSLRNCALAIASAVMLVLAFPDSNWWWLAWFAFVPVVMAITDRKLSIPAFLWSTFGTAYFFRYHVVARVRSDALRRFSASSFIFADLHRLLV